MYYFIVSIIFINNILLTIHQYFEENITDRNYKITLHSWYFLHF